MGNQDDRYEMTKLRWEVYGGQAHEFIEIIEESLLLKGWNVPSRAYDFVNMAMIMMQFKKLPGRVQRLLLERFGKSLQQNKVLNDNTDLHAKDDYPDKLWKNGFSSQSTQKYLF